MDKRMTVRLGFVGLAAVASSAGSQLHAQRLADVRLAVHPIAPRETITHVSLMAGDTTQSVVLMVLSGVAAGAAGAMAVGYAGEKMDKASCGPDEIFCGLGGAVVGAFVGETFALPLGVHIAGRKKGSYSLELLTSLGITALGVASANVTGGWSLAFIPPLQLWACIAQELRGAKRAR